MEIVPIFANQLYAFQYENETENEYDRNIELWTNPYELLKFAKAHVKGVNYNKYVNDRIEDAEQIIDLIEEISVNKSLRLESFFEPLSEKEYVIKILQLQKGKARHTFRKNDLRFYAIKIDENCFIITGGAIKLSQTMQEHELTQKELDKLKKCRQYLKDNDVFDNDSFFELIAQ